MHPYEVLRRPVVTEKSTMLSAQGKYVFEVMPAANKHQIKAAVEKAFDVKVLAVNTSNERGRRPRSRNGRRDGNPPTYKKAIVTVAPGDQIEFFEGV
ncbi:MAG: 50S ribosomal protein L23 [Chloroflexi bacterium]|nr:50S ribosomal protein L23 [Chloroflexota bacterium]MQC82969.1 50S ribosomal protein L23 [Chloroflexota bacterium]